MARSLGKKRENRTVNKIIQSTMFTKEFLICISSRTRLVHNIGNIRVRESFIYYFCCYNYYYYYSVFFPPSIIQSVGYCKWKQVNSHYVNPIELIDTVVERYNKFVLSFLRRQQTRLSCVAN